VPARGLRSQVHIQADRGKRGVVELDDGADVDDEVIQPTAEAQSTEEAADGTETPGVAQPEQTAPAASPPTTPAAVARVGVSRDRLADISAVTNARGASVLSASAQKRRKIDKMLDQFRGVGWRDDKARRAGAADGGASRGERDDISPRERRS
jgi:hypothetical protein